MAREHGHPAVTHLCELDEEHRIGQPVCGLAPGRTIEYPSGAIDCMECHTIVADRGRNRQGRAFDLSDEESE